MTHWGDKDKDGYIEYSRLNPQGLFHQGWKDGFDDHLKIKPPVAIVEAQGYLYAAYQTLAFLDAELGKKSVYDEALARSHFLKQRFNHDFWVTAEHYFALALDGEKTQRVVVTSNPGHLLFTGILFQDKIAPLISRLFQPDLWTPYGIRTHSSADADFDPYSYHRGSVWPHDNWVIYTGLKNVGFHRHADKIKKALLQAFTALNRIPELYAVENNNIVDLSEKDSSTANPLQAWASAGLLEMIWED
jgi:glycogen debranching enzyme